MELLLRDFGNDPTVIAIAALVALDVVLGVSAALANKQQKFQFSYIADFLKADVLGKLVPYAGLWIVLHLTGDIELGGIEAVEEGVGVFIIASVSASVLNSLRDLGILPSNTPDAIAGNDPNSNAPVVAGPATDHGTG